MKALMLRFFLVLGFLGVIGLLFATDARADGETRFSGGQYQFYNGSMYRSTYDLWAGGVACSPAGAIRYNSTRYTLQQCNGSQWKDLNRPLEWFTCSGGWWNSTGTYCQNPSDSCNAGYFTSQGGSVCCEGWPAGTCDTGIYYSYCWDDGDNNTYQGTWIEGGSSCPSANCSGYYYSYQAPSACCGSPGSALCIDAGSCFISGTPVAMADGTKKNIEDVKVDDMVASSSGPQRVYLVMKPRPYKGKIYGFNGGKPFFTPNHPFMTLKGWRSLDPEMSMKESPGIRVSYLEIGDVVLRQDGSSVKIEELNHEEFEGFVYNISVENSADYYADGYWVHNVAIAKE